MALEHPAVHDEAVEPRAERIQPHDAREHDMHVVEFHARAAVNVVDPGVERLDALFDDGIVHGIGPLLHDVRNDFVDGIGAFYFDAVAS